MEVLPALIPPVRYRGRTFIRIGPRRDIASEAEERILQEKRIAYMATFDAMPCFGSSLNDIDTRFITEDYLPQIIDKMELRTDKRNFLLSIYTTHRIIASPMQLLFYLERIHHFSCMDAMFNTFNSLERIQAQLF